MIKTVYFDLGNVLLFFSLPKMFAQMGDCTGMSPSEVKELLYDTPLRELYEKGQINTEQLFKTFQRHAPNSFSLREFVSSFSNIFTLNKELCPLVEKLKQAGIRLVLLSNTSECHFNYAYSHYPIIQLFDHKILSFEVGAWKPDPRIFHKALAHAHCDLQECFYTDDIPEFISSARKAGLPGEIFTDVPKLKKQLIDRGCNFLA